MISEDFGIDVDSVMLHWWVTVTETDEQLAAGESTMQVNQTNQMGQRMQFDGVLDLNEVDEVWMQEELLCNIYLTGRDMAGNSFEVAPNNSRNQPFHSWQMHHVQPEFVLTQNAVSLSKLQISVDETSAVQIDVQNIGSLEGEAEVTIEIVKLDGTTELLRRTNVQVNAVSRETLVVDWKPTNSGLQWVKVTSTISRLNLRKWTSKNLSLKVSWMVSFNRQIQHYWAFRLWVLRFLVYFV